MWFFFGILSTNSVSNLKNKVILNYVPSGPNSGGSLSIGKTFCEEVVNPIEHPHGGWVTCGHGCGCGHMEQSNGDGVGSEQGCGCGYGVGSGQGCGCGHGVGCGHIQSVVDGVGWGEVCCCVYIKQSDDAGVGIWHLEQSVKVARFAVGFGIVVFIMTRHNVSSELGTGFSVIALAPKCPFKFFVSFVFWSGFIVVCFLPMKWK